MPSGQLFDLRHGPGVAFRQALVDHSRGLSHRFRHCAALLFTIIPDCLQHAFRREEGIVVHIHTGRKCVLLLCHVAEFSERVCIVPFMACGLNHPQAHDVLQVTEAVFIAALIGEVALSAFLTADRMIVFDAHQGPGSGADVQAVLCQSGNGNDRGSGVMGGRQHHFTGKAHLILHFLRKASHHRPRHVKRPENGALISQSLDQLIIPLLRFRAHQLGRGGVCVLRQLISRQQKMKIIRQHQKLHSLFHVFRLLLFHRHELVDGVEHLLLDSRPGIQLSLRNDGIDLLVHSLRPSVAVAIGISQHVVLFIQQYIVHRPGIDSHALRNLSRRLTGL